MPAQRYGAIRVIGSREIYRLFLPCAPGLFSQEDFFLVPPKGLRSALSQQIGDYSVTILVNPDDYGSADIEAVSDQIWLWYLRPCAMEADSSFDSAGRLHDFEANELILRKEFALQVGLLPNRLTIVSDPKSFEVLVESGVPTIMSPPPVSSATNHLAVWRQAKGNFALLHHETTVANLYLEALEQAKTWDLAEALSPCKNEGMPRYLIVLPENSLPTFQYGIAIGAVHRYRVLGPVVKTSWGLEPGLDYLQFSSPEELSWMVKHTVRYPNSTDLMASRMASKAGTFEPTKVIQRILNTITSASF